MKFDEFKAKYMQDNGRHARRKPRHIEEAIQVACVDWFRVVYGERYLCFAVPNGGSRNAIEARNLKRSGALAGVSDLIIVSDHDVLFVEMKTKTGKQSGYQKTFQKNVERLGFRYVVCRSLDEFRLTIHNFLEKESA